MPMADCEWSILPCRFNGHPACGRLIACSVRGWRAGREQPPGESSRSPLPHVIGHSCFIIMPVPWRGYRLMKHVLILHSCDPQGHLHHGLPSVASVGRLRKLADQSRPQASSHRYVSRSTAQLNLPCMQFCCQAECHLQLLSCPLLSNLLDKLHTDIGTMAVIAQVSALIFSSLVRSLIKLAAADARRTQRLESVASTGVRAAWKIGVSC